MKVFEIITEKRKNPKTSINKQLADIYNNADILEATNQPNCFVSFTEIDKLGINPKSTYNTPLGIYSYPASYIMDRIGGNNPMDNLPFAGNQPFANVFKANGNIVDLKHMQNSQAVDYYRLIAKLWAEHSGQSWKESVDMIEMIIKDSETYSNFSEYVGGRFWYVTREIAHHLARKYNSPTKNTHNPSVPVAWNKLFRDIGIDGCVDFGVGIIHTSEPTQAVFFSIKSIQNNKRLIT